MLRLTGRRRSRAFTLVELLVVIGIIAALIGILLPVLSGVSARGRDIKCQSSTRQIMQALFGYAAEHKGSMPYGFYWNRSNPTDWEEASDNVNGQYISWAAMVGRYMTRRGTGIDDDSSTDLKLNFPETLVCAEAIQSRNHINSYVINFIVGVSPMYEHRIGGVPPQAQTRPPRQNHLLKDTAVIWETGILPGWDEISGYLVGADIDDERFWHGAHTPQYRYYSIRDPFGQIPPGLFGQNRPVLLSVGSHVFQNREPGPISVERWPYQGNLRFRHNRGTTCNVGLADGSVRQYTAKLDPGNKMRVLSHDALRRYFMIKWPPGVPPNRSRPH